MTTWGRLLKIQVDCPFLLDAMTIAVMILFLEAVILQ
jgi:hypothetical protein